MRNLLFCAALVALVGCGGGGSNSQGTLSPFFGLRTGLTDYYASGNGTTTPTATILDTAGVVNRNGTFSFNVQRTLVDGAAPDKITGRVDSQGTISSAKLVYIDGDGVNGNTITLSGTGTAELAGEDLMVTVQFPQTGGDVVPRKYVLTLRETTPTP